ncbi:MAG TPA: ATP-binding protein [Puia sp.]|jgi:signal transduction histidine kinase|nr:ATP-binding protein [Puia sp.]
MTFFIDNQSLFARQLVESVSDIIYVLDLEKNDFQFLNSRAREMLRLSERSDLDVILHPDDRQKRKEHLSAVCKLADNTAKEINVRLLAKDGHYKWFHIRDLVFQRKINGKVSQITGIIRPATETTSDDGNDEMTRLVAQKNRQLQFLHSELQTFTTLVAQDYLETLRQVYISLEMIISAEAHQFSNPSKAHLRRAQSMLQKLNLLTKDIVSYAAIEVPNDKSSHADLNEIVQGVTKDLGARLEAARATVRYPNLPVVKGHPILLQVLFNHILTNSIRFRHPVRPLIITITSQQVISDDIRHPAAAPGRSYHKVEIKDNGMGFDPADSEKVFEMFYQGHDKAKYKGSGMGLAIVRKIMDIHGGYVLADTILGEGTGICCYFPV